MNAYLFSSVVTCTALRPTTRNSGPERTCQTWDSCNNQIVFGYSLDDARQRFESWQTTPNPDDPVAVVVRNTTGAPFVDKLLTESGNLPLNWPEVAQQVAAQLESTPVDDYEQGYWVDVNQVVPSNKISFSVNTLQNDVPEEVRSGLNWSESKKFFFVLSVLAPLPVLPPTFESEPEESQENDDGSIKPMPMSVAEIYSTFPQALDKEAAVLIRARNSVVAAWLWRRYAANGPLATKAIRIDPWCEAINLK